jgi:hypothetical protein
MLHWIKALASRTDTNARDKGIRRAHPQGRRLVFVGGAPRSGTTLLQHVLDSHPNVYGGPEYDCVPAIVHAWREVVENLARGRIAAFGGRGQIDAAFANLIEDLLLPAADDKGAEVLSEKTPLNVMVFADLLELFPHCRAIHIVRDPRAVIASQLNVGKRARAKNEPIVRWAEDYQATIRVVRDALDSGLRASQRFGPRLLTVTYEGLVSRPEETIRRVCDFLGLSFDPAMLEPHSRKHPDQDAQLGRDNGTWVDPRLGFRAIEASRVHVWRQDLDADQVAAINDAFRAHPLLRDLGYTIA